MCYSQKSVEGFETARKHFAVAVKLNPDNMRALYGFYMVLGSSHWLCVSGYCRVSYRILSGGGGFPIGQGSFQHMELPHCDRISVIMYIRCPKITAR